MLQITSSTLSTSLYAKRSSFDVSWESWINRIHTNRCADFWNLLRIWAYVLVEATQIATHSMQHSLQSLPEFFSNALFASLVSFDIRQWLIRMKPRSFLVPNSSCRICKSSPAVILEITYKIEGNLDLWCFSILPLQDGWVLHLSKHSRDECEYCSRSDINIQYSPFLFVVCLHGRKKNCMSKS